jgi:hypothetical protein
VGERLHAELTVEPPAQRIEDLVLFLRPVPHCPCSLAPLFFFHLAFVFTLTIPLVHVTDRLIGRTEPISPGAPRMVRYMRTLGGNDVGQKLPERPSVNYRTLLK